MEDRRVDVCIIGAGPIGLACGIEAQKKGLSHLIVDRGCLVNSIYRYPSNMTFFSTSEKLEIGNVPFVSHLPKPNRQEALEYYRRVSLHWNLSLSLYTEVLDVKDLHEFYLVQTSKGVFEVKSIIVATGFYDIPNFLGIKGEELGKVSHYYKEPHPYFGQKVAVIGASNSAVDAALEIYRKGGEVTMIIKGGEISDHVKYWVKPDIENRIKEGAIRVFFHSRVLQIEKHRLILLGPQGEMSIANDFVLALTGYVPDFDFLRRLGIHIGKDENETPYYDPDTMETNKRNIFLAGVICGGMATHTWFIENSRVHAIKVMEVIEKKQAKWMGLLT
jgi:putative YpdA family bacillithiol system oxidoreductase